MAQIHYVVFYDTETEEWCIDTDAEGNLLPDGMVWDWAGCQQWDLAESTIGWNDYGKGEVALRSALGQIGDVL